MSQTSIDYLFQLTVPGPERPIAAIPRGGELRPVFDDHLSRAAVTTSNDSSQADRRDALADRSTKESSTYRASSSNNDPTPPHDSAPQSAGHANTAPTEPAADHEPDSQDGDSAMDAEAQPTIAPTDEPSEVEQSADETEIVLDEEELADAASEIASPQVATSNVETTQAVIAESVDGKTIEQPAAIDEAFDRRATTKVDPTVKLIQEPETDNGIEQPLNAAAQSENANQQANQQAVSSTRVPGDELLEKESSRPALATNEKEQKRVVHSHAIQEVGTKGGEEPTATPVSEPTAIQVNSDSPIKSKRATENKKPSSDEVRQNAPLRNNVDAGARPEAIAIAAHVAAQAIDVTVKSAIEGETSQPSSRGANAKSDSLIALLDRSQTGVSAAKRGRANAADEDAPRVDATRFVGRVAKAFQTAHERGGTLNLRLSPPELGSLRLELTVKDGAMSASLEAETASARRVLLDHLPALRERLAEQNIRIERFDVDVRREGSGGGSADDRTAQQQQRENQQQQDSSPRRPAVPPRIAAGTQHNAIARPHQINDTEINLVV